MRIALFTPVSPVRSALVDHIEGLLPVLAQTLDITVVTSGDYHPTWPILQSRKASSIPWISYADFMPSSDEFDLIIYQLGDEAHIHGYMFDALRRYPGLIFLHDLVLHHAIVELTLNRGDPDAYLAEMRYSYGDEGEQLARRVMAGEGEEIFTRYPLVERVLDSSLGVVGYNGYMCNKIRELRPDMPVRYIPYHSYLPPGITSEFDSLSFRLHLGLEGRPVVASFGLFNSQKRMDVALRAFRRLLKRHPDAMYLLIGAPINNSDLMGRIGALGLTDRVRLTGWLAPLEFIKHMFVADIAVQLRYPHVGGTPYTPLRLLGLGVPTIISDIEPLAEIPDDVVVRVSPNDADEETMVFAAMDYLLTHKDVARALSENAKRYIARKHNIVTIAEQHVAFIQEVAAERQVLQDRVQTQRRFVMISCVSCDGLTNAAGAALAELGVMASNRQQFYSVARAIRDLIFDVPHQGH